MSNGTLSGACAATSDTYDSDALIPGAMWRTPSAAERAGILVSQKTASPYSGIATIRMPVGLFEQLRALAIPELRSGLPLQRNLGSALRDRLRRYLRCRGELLVHGIATHPPDLPTTTQGESGRFIGLHVDNWDGLPLRKRENARLRVCANVGLSNRYFLFVNLTLVTMWQVLTHFGHLGKCISPQVLGRAFLRAYPAYPVIRVLLKPGEAYIAPTDNVCHDGSTLGSTSPDVTFTARGYFPCQFEPIAGRPGYNNVTWNM